MAISAVDIPFERQRWGEAVIVLSRAACGLLVHGMVGFGRPATLCRRHGRVRR